MRVLGRKRKKMAAPSVYGRLRSSKHFGDPRSWSSDPKKNSEYLLETMTQLTPTICEEDLVDGRDWKDTSNDLPNGTDLDVLIMKDKLSVASDKILTLEKKNSALMDENSKTNSEVTNLRRFVSDLILHLDHLKSQNNLRRCQMTTEAVERIEKIYHHLKMLSSQIDLIGQVNSRFENVKVEHDKLKQECHIVKKTITVLESEKSQLIQLIEVKQKDLNELKARAEEANLAVASASILRERIYARENKISELTAAVDEKTTLIDELTAEMTAVSNSFKKKEHAILKKLENVEKHLKNKTEENCALVDKLHATELLAGDLEILKNQLKVTNKSLEETVENYKRQFEKATLSSNLMAHSASKLQHELNAIQVEMEQQAKFPQNANTMLYFAHLNKLVTLHDETDEDSSKSELMTEIKEVIVKLKKEMWGANIMPSQLNWADTSVQTCQKQESKATACEPEVISTESQTVLPDNYIDELTRARQAVLRISQTVQSLETAVETKTKALDEFERQVVTSFSQDDSLMTELAATNDRLNERLTLVSGNLQNSIRMLNQALNEVENEAKARQSCTNLLETVLQGTVAEYNNYVQVLLMCLKNSEEKLDRLSQNIQIEMDLNRKEVEILTKKVEKLSYELTNERNASTELSREILSLEEKLEKTMGHSKEIESHSEKCENILKDIATTIECDSIDQISDRVKHFAEELLKYGALNDELIKKLRRQYRATRNLRKILRNNRQINKKLKNDVRASQRKHRKSVKAVKSLTRVVDESKKAQMSLIDEVKRYEMESKELKAKGLSLFESLTASEQRIASLQSSLNNYYEKNAVDELHKAKLERFIFKLFKRIKKYKSLLNKKLEDKGTITIETNETFLRDEILSVQIDRLKEENANLSSTIDDLRGRLSSLFAIEEKHPGQSVGCQNTLGDDIARAQSEELLATVKIHYEGILEALGEDYRADREAARKKFANSLLLMKEAAEREVAEVKLSWTEEIGQIKTKHDDEMNRVKRERDEELLREKEIIRVDLMLVNKQEIDAIKENYEETIKAREKEFRNKINEMNEQESRNKLEHQLEVDRIRAEMKQEMADIEERDSRVVTRLEQENKLRIQALEADFKKRKDQVRETDSQTESAAYTNQGTYTDFPPDNPAFSRVSDFVDIQSIRCEVKSDVNNVLSMVPFLAGGHGHGDSNYLQLQDGRDVLLRKIAELEYKLASSSVQNQKLTMYERQIRLNEMKLHELGSLLEQEVQHSQRVHLRLARQFNRSEILQAEKEEMGKQIKTLQLSVDSLEKGLEKEREKSCSMQFEIEKLKSHPPGSQKLEESLNRLKDKIDQAVECEKRLTEELENKEPVKTTDMVEQHYPERDLSEKPVEQLQLIVIKERATLQAWHSHSIY